ncbi:hypothetical protein [Serratia marcescens]|uniref:hypothetical protein n=1 Tax=Serratia marcescens TaxID=615 RepID=UPI001F1564B7|nr:hypothetical protein [Serratia marcescens]
MDLFKFWSNAVYDDSNGYIHQDDVVVLDELSKLVDGDIDRTFPPGPFFGPLKTAKIVLCYANPGIDEPSIQGVNAEGGRVVLLNQLTGIEPYPYQLEGWRQWFSKCANSLFDGDISLASESIAVFNLLPYASKNMDKLERVANCLPSVWMAQNHLRTVLIPKAKRKEILLIMCRSKHLWGLKTSLGCENILINGVRSGFTQEVKKKVHNWIALLI